MSMKEFVNTAKVQKEVNLVELSHVEWICLGELEVISLYWILEFTLKYYEVQEWAEFLADISTGIGLDEPILNSGYFFFFCIYFRV